VHLKVKLIGILGGSFLLQRFQTLLLRIEILRAEDIVLQYRINYTDYSPHGELEGGGVTLCFSSNPNRSRDSGWCLSLCVLRFAALRQVDMRASVEQLNEFAYTFALVQQFKSIGEVRRAAANEEAEGNGEGRGRSRGTRDRNTRVKLNQTLVLCD
jgi:hypothetical protein